MKGAQGAWRARRLPARLDQQAADLACALLADAPVLGRLAARLTDARVQPEIGDQLPRRRKRPISPTAASSAIAVTTLTPGIVIRRSASGSLSASAPRSG